MDSNYDVIVIGGGPAGATTATLLAQQGRRVVVLERADFPRHHIGESLMPQSYWTFKRLGMLEKLRGTDFVPKESVQFVSGNGRESAPFFFTDRDPNEWSTTWQVRRDEFDKMMLDNAREHGVVVRYGVRVREVIFDGGKAVGVRAAESGEEFEIFARVVVDATGQSGLISRQLGLRYPDEKLRQSSVYAHYKGCYLEDGRNMGATIILHTHDQQGWFWYIPLRQKDALVSVGVVAPPMYLTSGRDADPETILAEEIENCPGIKRRLMKAERVGKVYVCADFSYRSRRIAGDGWVLVGDAFGFLDPVYSSGVMLALKSGEYAADAIHDALNAGDVSGKRLGRFGPRLAAGVQTIRSLVYAFYDKNFSIGRFVKDNPKYHDHIVRILIGDVFNDDVNEVFEVMGRSIELPGMIELEEPAASPTNKIAI